MTVADLDASIRKCTELGGTIIAGPMTLSAYGRFCVIRDPPPLREPWPLSMSQNRDIVPTRRSDDEGGTELRGPGLRAIASKRRL